MNRRAFTLIEIMATLLLIGIGLASLVALMGYAVRLASRAQADATALITARTVADDATPCGLTADTGDTDGDGWSLQSGNLNTPPSGDYAFTVAGWINGYYIVRKESSRTADQDVIHGQARRADVQVEVFLGGNGERVAALRAQILRRAGG